MIPVNLQFSLRARFQKELNFGNLQIRWEMGRYAAISGSIEVRGTKILVLLYGRRGGWVGGGGLGVGFRVFFMGSRFRAVIFVLVFFFGWRGVLGCRVVAGSRYRVFCFYWGVSRGSVILIEFQEMAKSQTALHSTSDGSTSFFHF